MAKRGEMVPVSVRCVEKRGACEFYEVGDEFVWSWATERDIRCNALMVTLRTWAPLCGLGVPSWEDDPSTWLISCPSKKGIVLSLEEAGRERGR